MLKIGLSLFALSMTFATNAWSVDCGFLKEGLFNVTSTASDYSSAKSLAYWYCEQQSVQKGTSASTDASATVPIKGVPVQLGYDSSKQSLEQWTKSFCSSLETSELTKSRVRLATKTVVPNFEKLIEQCKTTGIRMWLERGDDDRFVFLRINFVGAGKARATAKVQFLPERAGCKSQEIDLFTSITVTIACDREGEAVAAVINSNDGEILNSSVSMPPAYKAPPAKLEPYQWVYVADGDCYGNIENRDRKAGQKDLVEPDPGECNQSTLTQIAVCWDGTEKRSHPTGMKFCMYKRVTAPECTGGKVSGAMYACVTPLLR